MNQHVTKRFLEWSEKKGAPAEQSKIEAHLLACETCRLYYHRMSALLDGVDLNALPVLQPDPFLPTRIKAAAHQKQGQPHFAGKTGMTRLGWMISTATLAFAITFGVYLGKDLATSGQAPDSSNITEIEISQTLWDNSLADSWADVIDNSAEGEQ